MFVANIVILFSILLGGAAMASWFIFQMSGGITVLPTSRKARQKLMAIVGKKIAGRRTFYDLGCGDGSVVADMAKAFPQLTVNGVEKSFTQFITAKARCFLQGRRAHIILADLFKTDLKTVDIVYVYLPRNLFSSLEQKFDSELKRGACVITNTAPLPFWGPKETIVVHPVKPDFEKLFVYEKD